MIVNWFDAVTWVAFTLKGLQKDLILLCLFQNATIFPHNCYMVRAFIKPEEIWAWTGAETLFSFYWSYLFCVYYRLGKQSMVLISGLMNICEMYLSTEIEHRGRGEKSTNFPLVWISEVMSRYII